MSATIAPQAADCPWFDPDWVRDHPEKAVQASIHPAQITDEDEYTTCGYLTD